MTRQCRVCMCVCGGEMYGALGMNSINSKHQDIYDLVGTNRRRLVSDLIKEAQEGINDIYKHKNTNTILQLKCTTNI